MQTRQRRSFLRQSPALIAGWFLSTACLLRSAETQRPGKWRCTSRGLRSYPEWCLGMPTSGRSSEWRGFPRTLSSAGSCGWELWGFFPHLHCRRYSHRSPWRMPGCRRSTGQCVGWWFCWPPTWSRPERTPGLDHSSTPDDLLSRYLQVRIRNVTALKYRSVNYWQVCYLESRMKYWLKLMNDLWDFLIVLLVSKKKRATNTTEGEEKLRKAPLKAEIMSLLFAEDQIKVSGDSPSRWMAALALLLIHFIVEWGSEGRKKNVSLSQIIHKDSNVALKTSHKHPCI